MLSPLPYGNQSKRILPTEKPTTQQSFFKEEEQSVYNGVLMTVAILGSTFVVRRIDKNTAPHLSMANLVSLGIVTILSKVVIDYGKKKDWIPKNI